MGLTEKNFEDFIERLKFHNRGEGVNDHCTANPIFIVQRKHLIAGIDLDYDPLYYWTDDSHEIELTDDELVQQLAEDKADGIELEEYDLSYDDEIKKADGDTAYQKIGYAEQWEYVNAHFTKESAEAFIDRKKHDYRELRIYVDSQYWCPEFNAIVDGLISGEIGFIKSATK